MPEGEKYVTENGSDVLHVKENDQWVKYKESEMYKKKKQEEENESWLQKWVYEQFYINNPCFKLLKILLKII
jgi:hypothetical protein